VRKSKVQKAGFPLWSPRPSRFGCSVHVPVRRESSYSFISQLIRFAIGNGKRDRSVTTLSFSRFVLERDIDTGLIRPADLERIVNQPPSLNGVMLIRQQRLARCEPAEVAISPHGILVGRHPASGPSAAG
jgi:hypothetical protein